MALAPASLSISAEMSPVKAPEASAWQSCAPIATGELRARVAKPAISVAGGQIRRSMRVASGPAPSMMAANSVADCCRPFIFQLPAISGRSALAMPYPCCFLPKNRVAELRETNQRGRSRFLGDRAEARAVVAAEGRSPYDAAAHGSARPPKTPLLTIR